MKIENKDLIEKADELDLDVEDFESEDDLQKAIDDKLKEESEDEDDLDVLKEKVKFKDGEAKKAFAARDRAKKNASKLKSTIDDLEEKLEEAEEKLSNAPNMEEFKKLQKQIEELQSEKEEKELEKLDETEKVQVRFQKKLEELEKKMGATENSFKAQLEEKEKELSASRKINASLRKSGLDAEIVTVATKHGAYNPEQIKRILSGDFVYDDKLETYSFLVRDSKGKIVDEKTVEEAVTEFLEDPDNANLVRSKAKSGFGVKDLGGDLDDKKKLEKPSGGPTSLFSELNRRSGEYDPKDPKLIAEADKKGLSVEDHIQTLKIRDAKFKKIKGITSEGE